MSKSPSLTPKEVKLPPQMKPPPSQKGYVSFKGYRMGECMILLGQENIGGNAGIIVDDVRWHLSISHSRRMPTWNEIKAAREHLLPDDVHCALPFPAKGHWLSVHEFCLHLWEIKDAKAIAQWESDAAAANRMGINNA